jgi:hypothetical protein
VPAQNAALINESLFKSLSATPEAGTAGMAALDELPHGRVLGCVVSDVASALSNAIG